MSIFNGAGKPVVRPEDLAVLRIETINMKVVRDANGKQRLTKNGQGNAYLILHFPPQSFAEETFFEPLGKAGELPSIPARARIANESRLVFIVDKDIEYSLASVLEACKKLPLKVSAAANVLRDSQVPTSNKPQPGLPNNETTSIEMPWRLILSPHSGGRWRHATTPVCSGKTSHTELWHSRLVIPHDDKTEIEPPYPDVKRTTRAVWALRGEGTDAANVSMSSQWPSALPNPDDNLFLSTLNNRQRYQIAHLSSNFNKSGYTPEPIDTNLMILSALGGWLDSRGAWNPPAGFGLEEWVHRATMGREHYVRVVERGFLFPFGHRVSQVTISERKFHNEIAGNPAYLRQRTFLVIREKERAFDGDLFRNAKKKDGASFARKFPFSSVRLLTETTPNLDQPEYLRADGNTQPMFWPHVSYQPFRFQCVATDLDGRRVLFDLPMIFVGSAGADYSEAERFAIVAMNEFANKGETFNTANLDSQRVALAASMKSGDTSVQVKKMKFGGFAENTNLSLRNYSENMSLPIWAPQVEKIEAQIEAVARLSGSQESHTLTYNRQYLQIGFNSTVAPFNKGEVFADIGSGSNIDFSSQGDKSGGFIQPNLKPAALSRLVGPVMGGVVDSFIAGSTPEGAGFPRDKFSPISGLPMPYLFGCIPLGAVIEAVAGSAGVPKFVSEAGSKLDSFVNDLDRLYGFVSNIPAQPAGIAQGALTAFQRTLEDLRDQAAAYAGFQRNHVQYVVQNQNIVQQVRDAIIEMQNFAGTVQGITQDPLNAAVQRLLNALNGVINALGNFANTAAPSGLPSLDNLRAAIGTLKTALAELKNALNELITAAANRGIPLPSSITQGISDAITSLEALLTQVEGLIDIVQNVLDAIEDLRGKLDAVLTKLENFANAATPSGLPSWNDVKTAIAAARNALTQLRAAANASYYGLSLPAGFRQSILNTVQKLEALLTQIEELTELIDAGLALWSALKDIINTDGGIAALFSNAQGLVTKLGTLKTAINGFRTALANASLLSGAPRNAIVSALKAVEDIIGNAADLAKLVELLTGDELTIRLDWNPTIKSWPGPKTALFRANNPKGLLLAVEGRVKKSGNFSPKISAYCSLKHFDLVLIAPAAFLELNFEKIEFLVDSAAKMNVDVLLSDIKFVGPLSFVETLRDLIPLDGFSDPPYLDITPKGIDAGFSISLPSIACGILNISNISLGAGFTVPFIGQPLSVRFNFCRREQPFTLAVGVFGGGGFFGLTIDPSGVQILEASFEFGASISVNLGVASGGVYVMAGIYFRMELSDASLTGYFRLGGKVSVLKLISASIELYLSLSYEFRSGKCVGRASLTVEISLLFFSTRVTITCERKFAGSNGDPTVRQMLGYKPELMLEEELDMIGEDTEYAWRDYLEAFA